MLKESRYNVFVPLKKGFSLAYNSLNGTMAKWDSDDLRMYRKVLKGQSLSESEVQDFLKGGFLVPEDTNELRKFNEWYRMDRFSRSNMTLTISPTMACNFACDYCFQSHDRASTPITPEVQDKIMEMLTKAKGIIQRLHVAWYGGEPLLQFETLKKLSGRITDFCRHSRIGYDSMIVTNGYHLTGKVAEELWGLGVKTIQVTLDGCREDHDTRRVLLSGGATFDKIIANLKEATAVYRGRIVVRVNVDFRNSAGVSELWTQLRQAGLAGLKNLQLYYAPVEAITEFCRNAADFSMSKVEYGQLEADLVRRTYRETLTGIPYPPRSRGTCAAVRPFGFVINPDGEMFKCWDTVNKPEFKVGDIFNPEAITENPVYKSWLSWNPLKDNTCLRCKLLPSCAGACGFKSLYREQTMGEAAELPCVSWRYNINERLLMRAEIAKVIQEDDYHPGEVETDPESLIMDDAETDFGVV